MLLLVGIFKGKENLVQKEDPLVTLKCIFWEISGKWGYEVNVSLRPLKP